MWGFAGPQLLKRLRSTERFEPLVSSDGALRAQLPQARDRAEVTHRLVITQRAIDAERPEIRQPREMREAIGRDPGDVPEEIEIEHAVEPRETGEPGIGEGSVNQKAGVQPSQLRHARQLQKAIVAEPS